MRRHALTDEQWQRLQAVLPPPKGRRSHISDREFIDAVLYRAKTGVPWRDLPGHFGPWHNIYNRFSNWARRGLWKHIYKALRVRVDKTGSIVDGSNVRAHQDAAGGKGGSTEIVWVVVEADSQRSSTSSQMEKVAPSTSRSRQATAMR
jgi:transposase